MRTFNRISTLNRDFRVPVSDFEVFLRFYPFGDYQYRVIAMPPPNPIAADIKPTVACRLTIL